MNRGFTLLETLIVITLMSIFFSLLSYSFYSSVKNSYLLLESAELTREELLLFWNLNRKVAGATELHVRRDGVFMITPSGDYYQGIVKCAYIYRDGWLYYYEFPYPYGDLTFYEEDKLIRIGKFKELSFRAYANGQYFEEFIGIPQWIELNTEGKIIRVSL